MPVDPKRADVRAVGRAVVRAAFRPPARSMRSVAGVRAVVRAWGFGFGSGSDARALDSLRGEASVVTKSNLRQPPHFYCSKFMWPICAGPV
jgi:hypothetical protein